MTSEVAALRHVMLLSPTATASFVALCFLPRALRDEAFAPRAQRSPRAEVARC
jgi:hypothetical protein